MSIIQATTPTIKYTFSVVDPETIVTAYMTIIMDGEVIIERDLTTATLADGVLSWTLTQEESLSLSNKIEIQLNWLTDSGVRGASKKKQVSIDDNSKDEVI